MNAEEIRQWSLGNFENFENIENFDEFDEVSLRVWQVQATLEVAAQLAELNTSLSQIASRVNPFG